MCHAIRKTFFGRSTSESLVVGDEPQSLVLYDQTRDLVCDQKLVAAFVAIFLYSCCVVIERAVSRSFTPSPAGQNIHCDYI